MRHLVIALLLAPCLVGQGTPGSRGCGTVQTGKDDADRLTRVLRERGLDALVEAVLRPGREFWMNLKERLLKPDASTYFAEAVQDAASFPEMSGALMFQNGKELLVSPSGADAPEVALLLEAPMDEFVQPGSTVLFRGIPVAFSPAPFRLSMRVSKKEVRFLPPKNSPVDGK